MGAFLTIQALHEEGLGNKTIARRLDIDVRTVRKYVRRIADGQSQPRRRDVGSKLDPFQKQIAAKVEDGRTAVQIYTDLQGTSGFDASYETVKRRVRNLRPVEPEVYCRMQFVPGEEGQIDFGDVGRMAVDGRLRRVYLFVLTLCFSRMAYYELVLDQRVPTFLGVLRRAFEFLGGAPSRLKPDNLRSAVLIDGLGQRYYQQDFFRFCQHYGTVPDAARPGTPTDKGRVERDIRYAKSSAFNGRTFDSYEHGQGHLTRWRDEVANVRVHGTTRRRPVDLFEEERRALRPLPDEAYEVCVFGQYRVRKDCHVHVDSNYYSVPYSFVGQRVLVRVSEQEIHVVVDDVTVAQHPRARGKGISVTNPEHYPATKRLATQEIHRRRLDAIRNVGPHAAQLLRALREGQWVFRDQLLRLTRLLEAHGEEALERACERALFYGAASLDGAHALARILEQGLHELPLPGTSDSRSSQPDRDFGRALCEYDKLLVDVVEGLQ